MMVKRSTVLTGIGGVTRNGGTRSRLTQEILGLKKQINLTS